MIQCYKLYEELNKNGENEYGLVWINDGTAFEITKWDKFMEEFTSKYYNNHYQGTPFIQ